MLTLLSVSSLTNLLTNPKTAYTPKINSMSDSSNMQKNRLVELRKTITEVDAFIITELNNIYYLTGFTGSSGILVVTKKNAVLFTDYKHKEQSAREIKCADTVIIKNSLWDETLTHSIFKGVNKIGFEPQKPLPLRERIIHIFKRAPKAGFQPHIDYSTCKFIKNKLKDRQIVPLKDKIENLRIIKDASEIALIKKASHIADSSFNAVIPLIKPGITEKDIAIEFEFQIRKNGGSGVSFDTIIAFGPNAALHHPEPTSRKLKAKDTVLFDFGAVYERYVSDCARTLILGDNPHADKIYKIVEKAQESAIKAIKPDVSFKKVDAIARNLIIESGHGRCFRHSLGHGVGLEFHEAPTLSRRSKDFAKIGMVFSVEPGIYLQGFGGILIEDLVVLTDKGPEIITNATKAHYF